MGFTKRDIAGIPGFMDKFNGERKYGGMFLSLCEISRVFDASDA